MLFLWRCFFVPSWITAVCKKKRHNNKDYSVANLLCYGKTVDKKTDLLPQVGIMVFLFGNLSVRKTVDKKTDLLPQVGIMVFLIGNLSVRKTVDKKTDLLPRRYYGFSHWYYGFSLWKPFRKKNS
jgi:hypothetical protein